MTDAGKTAQELMKQAMINHASGSLFFGMLADHGAVLGEPLKLSDEEVLERLQRAIRLSVRVASEIESAFSDEQ